MSTTEWQPIETAEEDTVVLVANPNEGRLPVVAIKLNGVWYEKTGIYGNKLRPPPTIWIDWPRIPVVKDSE